MQLSLLVLAKFDLTFQGWWCNRSTLPPKKKCLLYIVFAMSLVDISGNAVMIIVNVFFINSLLICVWWHWRLSGCSLKKHGTVFPTPGYFFGSSLGRFGAVFHYSLGLLSWKVCFCDIHWWAWYVITRTSDLYSPPLHFFTPKQKICFEIRLYVLLCLHKACN